MLPDRIRLADYGLGHDERAREPQPVAERLGPRFLPWQLEQGVEESWEECERHAERIEALLGQGGRRQASDGGTQEHDGGAGLTSDTRKPTPDTPVDLFGNPCPRISSAT